MDGVPGLSPSQRKKLLDSKTIHDRGRALFRGVVSKGGVGVWELIKLCDLWILHFNMMACHGHLYRFGMVFLQLLELYIPKAFDCVTAPANPSHP